MEPASKTNSPRKIDGAKNQGFFRENIGQGNSPLRRSLKPGQFLDGGTSESNNNSSQISESNNLKSSQGELRFDLIKNLVKTEIPDDAEAENNPQNVQQEIFEQFNAQIEHSFSEQQQHLDEIFK